MSAVLAFRQKTEPVQTEPAEIERPSSPRESGIAPRLDVDALSEHLGANGIDLAQLSFDCCSPTTATRAPSDKLDRVYKCWSMLQGDLHKELGVPWDATSDEFSRQDDWGYLTYAGEVIAVVAFRWVDLSVTFSEDDTYFRTWSLPARQRLKTLGPEVCIASNLSVLPAWRGRAGEFSVKEVLVRLCVERSNSSAASVMAATLRNSRGMNLVFYRLGAEPIVTGVVHPHFNAAIDLVAVPKRDTTNGVSDDLMGSLARYLWRNYEEKGDDNAASVFG